MSCWIPAKTDKTKICKIALKICRIMYNLWCAHRKALFHQQQFHWFQYLKSGCFLLSLLAQAIMAHWLTNRILNGLLLSCLLQEPITYLFRVIEMLSFPCMRMYQYKSHHGFKALCGLSSTVFSGHFSYQCPFSFLRYNITNLLLYLQMCPAHAYFHLCSSHFVQILPLQRNFKLP